MVGCACGCGMCVCCVCVDFELYLWMIVCAGTQVSSLARIVRYAECVERYQWDHKGKSLLDFHTFSENTDFSSIRDVVLSSS